MRTRVIRVITTITAVAAVLGLTTITGSAVHSDESAQVGHVLADSAWGARAPQMNQP